MYTLYGFPKTRAFRVTWALEEIGLPYEYKLVNLLKGEHRRPPFSERNPSAKVPWLECEQGGLSESAAILTYLADKHGQQEFIPKPGTFERAHFEQMMYFLMTELEQPLWYRAKHTFILPEEYRIKQMLAVSDWEFERAADVFSTLLGEQEFVCGDTLTVADILATHILVWAQGESLRLPENLKQYADRMVERPAYRKAREVEASQIPQG
ncbi:glutathione S-transferase family protein [Alteromonas aestuariivivens]|uniref:Glutathione S-transferase family protein n=1 Tax=Alteromonas aestuariivivens TaxID=1938339 RepID=A0A3D8MDW9_9ALTE|nr:glutathione S-transferase family protein [Alteromonas aestuariivivens]RDV29035.1 glutathione S-transferase family protein [Alteromonas aestuariivivens]